MAALIDVRSEIANPSTGRLRQQIAMLMGAILFFDGYDLFNAAYVAPYVRAEWSLTPVQLGVLLSAGVVGLSIGSLLVGYLADRFGRRRMLMVSLWTISVGSLLLGTVAHDFPTFVSLRLVLGTGLGMVTPLALTYLNEWSPARAANRYATSVFVIGFAGGGIAAGLVGILLAPMFGWRALYIVGSLSLVVTLICQAHLPESLQFLALRQRWDEVRLLLQRLNPDRASDYAASPGFASMTPDGSPIGRPAGALRIVLMSRSTIVIWVVGALSLFCIHGLTNWLPTVMIGRGASVTFAFSLGTLVMVMQILGGLASAAIADRWQRRREVMAVWFAGGASAMLAFGYAQGFPAMTVLLAVAAFFIFGAQAVLNNFIALSYDLPIRATATGLAVGIARVGGVLGPLLIGVLQSLWPSFLLVFATFAGALLIAALLIMIARPEQDATGANLAIGH